MHFSEAEIQVLASIYRAEIEGASTGCPQGEMFHNERPDLYRYHYLHLRSKPAV